MDEADALLEAVGDAIGGSKVAAWPRLRFAAMVLDLSRRDQL